MREIRTSGSEGGGVISSPYPYQIISRLGVAQSFGVRRLVAAFLPNDARLAIRLALPSRVLDGCLSDSLRTESGRIS